MKGGGVKHTDIWKGMEQLSKDGKYWEILKYDHNRAYDTLKNKNGKKVRWDYKFECQWRAYDRDDDNQLFANHEQLIKNCCREKECRNRKQNCAVH